MYSLDDVFARLPKSTFRRGFALQEPERSYLRQKGLPLVMEHGASFIEQRLAPAYPARDGKQTPFRNHPVFVAQHATATCCRGCLEKWHGIPKGKPLRDAEKQHILAAVERWLTQQDTTD